MHVTGLGERGTRLRALAAKLKPRPAVPPFYVQAPDAYDEPEIRAMGWYMKRTRDGEADFLGHSAAKAELELALELHYGPGLVKRPNKRQKGA